MSLRHASRTALPNHYGSAQGDPQLRDAIATYVARSRGLAVDAADIVVTSGTTQSTDLVLRCLARPGDAVAVEEPTHPSLHRLIASHGIRLVTMPVDDDGSRVDGLPTGADRPRLAHVTPSHQFPLGVRMTIARRLELVRWAAANGGLILEDDYDSEYRFDGPPLPTLAALDATRVVYMGTMSKVLSPALRCGYLAAPREHIAAIVEMKDMIDGAVAWPVQQLMLHLLDSGNLERHVRRTRLQYAKARNTLQQALAPVSDMVTLGGIEAGLHAVLRPRDGLSVARIVELAAEQGVSLVTLSDFYLGTNPCDGLLMGYGALTEAQIITACAVLVSAIRQTSTESLTR